MSTPFLGEIRMFGGGFAPRNWAFCNGQTLSIAQYQALFALIGTTFGGNGIQTFQLPNLQGSLPIGQGQGPGLTNRVIGAVGGTENVTLLSANLPTHTHPLNASSVNASSVSIGPTLLPGKVTVTNGHFYTNNVGTPAPVFGNLNPQSTGPIGGNLPHPNLMPSLCVSFILSLSGMFPSRN